MSSCFILPPNFDEKSMSLSLQELLHDKPCDIVKSLNLNSTSTFTNIRSGLGFSTNDENSDQSYFLTFYTKESRLQKDSKDQIIRIKNDWEKLNKKEEERKSFNSNSNSNSKYNSFEASLETSIDTSPKFARAEMKSLYRSQRIRGNTAKNTTTTTTTTNDNNNNNNNQNNNDEIVEEEEECDNDPVENDQDAQQSDQSDDESDILDFFNQSTTPNILYNTFSRRGDNFDDDLQ